MVRKLKLWCVVGTCLALLLSTGALAQEYWEWSRFAAQREKYKYEITSYDTEYVYPEYDEDSEEYEEDAYEGKEVLVEQKMWQTLEATVTDEDTVQLTTTYTYSLPQSDVQDQVGAFFTGFLSPQMSMGGGSWMSELMFLGLFGEDLELEVGNSMQTFDGGRIRVAEKRIVAGIEGYVCSKFQRGETDEGKRIDILTAEWVIAPQVGLPLAVTIYEEEQPTYSMSLIEYERLD